MKNILKVLAVISIGVALVLMVLTYGTKPQVMGSAIQGQDYYATTTGSTPGLGLPTIKLLKNGSGSFASVIVTTAGATGGFTDVYDATTSDATQRDATQATSSILIAEFPNNLAAGTYVFDAQASRGLLIVNSATAGTRATSTITWR